MSHNASTGKVVEVSLRVPGRKPPPSEDQIRRLEEVAEARGNGVAGQLPPVREVIEPASPKAQPAPEESARGKGVRWTRTKDGARMRSTTVHLPIALHKRLALYCAEHDRKLSEVIAELVQAKVGNG